MNEKTNILSIKETLWKKLKEESAFWSYDMSDKNYQTVEDRYLIAWTLRFLDLPEINLLFLIYKKKQIKKAWKELLIPEGEYLYSLTKFFAWYYFDAKRPGSYVKFLQTQYYNKLIS